MLVYLARHLLPVSSPPVENGAVAVADGRVVAAGERAVVLQRAGADAELRDLGNVALVPGLVNSHTHLELSWLAGRLPPGDDYVVWLRRLLELRGDEDPATAAVSAKQALRTVIDRGTVAVGDVANHSWIVPILARSGLHGIAFHELLGFKAGDAEQLLSDAAGVLERLEADDDLRGAKERIRVALTAHAPHTSSAPLLRGSAGDAAASGNPLTIHVAESTAETELLFDGSGPLAELYDERGFWEASWKPPGLSPVEYLDRLGVLSPRTLAVHCVQLRPGDHSRLQARGVTVITCPRSNRWLGLGKCPVFELLREGIPVALGTDSLASAPDLDLFAEMQAVKLEQPSLSPAAILRMATLNGATALGIGDRLGAIEPGKLAKLVVVPLQSEETPPLEAVCSNPPVVFGLADAPWERAT
jgi:cytosine/adenosine deaminase-related metal-dependent hydrolase